MCADNSIRLPYNDTQADETRPKVYSYTRVSSKEQARNRQSVPDQEKQLKSFCDEHGLELLHSYSDVSTARHEHKVSKRPDFNEVCQLALENDYPVVVTFCHRFTRTFESYKRFKDRGGRLIAIELGLDGNEHEISALIKHGEAEAEQTSRTSLAGIASAQANGKKTGNRNPVAGRQASILARSDSRVKQLGAFMAEAAKARTAGSRTPDEVTIYLIMT
jgi:DNA invertase Pin-like site-specific DNA recombinase